MYSFQILIPAFIMGIAGSMHCMGMCGPLVLAMPQMRKWHSFILYHSGRVLTYACYGLVFGALGRHIYWFSWQQRISVGLGSMIILFVAGSKLLPRTLSLKAPVGFFYSLRSRMGAFVFNPNPFYRFLSGILNGLLPCGLVYMALAGAMMTGSAGQGVSFMAFFGLGTLPSMALVLLLGKSLPPRFKIYFKQAYPAILLSMAFLLILRGMNLGIPFLSPALQITASQPAQCH